MKTRFLYAWLICLVFAGCGGPKPDPMGLKQEIEEVISNVESLDPLADAISVEVISLESGKSGSGVAITYKIAVSVSETLYERVNPTELESQRSRILTLARGLDSQSVGLKQDYAIQAVEVLEGRPKNIGFFAKNIGPDEPFSITGRGKAELFVDEWEFEITSDSRDKLVEEISTRLKIELQTRGISRRYVTFLYDKAGIGKHAFIVEENDPTEFFASLERDISERETLLKELAAQQEAELSQKFETFLAPFEVGQFYAGELTTRTGPLPFLLEVIHKEPGNRVVQGVVRNYGSWELSRPVIIEAREDSRTGEISGQMISSGAEKIGAGPLVGEKTFSLLITRTTSGIDFLPSGNVQRGSLKKKSAGEVAAIKAEIESRLRDLKKNFEPNTVYLLTWRSLQNSDIYQFLLTIDSLSGDGTLASATLTDLKTQDYLALFGRRSLKPCWAQSKAG